jgi:hypothetical protein
MAAQPKLVKRDSGRPALDAPIIEWVSFFVSARPGIKLAPGIRRSKKPDIDLIFRDKPKGDRTYLDEASGDLDQWKAWLAASPEATILLALQQSGLSVADIDVKGGKRGDLTLAELAWIYGDGIKDTVTQLTPSGGAHFIYEGLPPGFTSLGDLGGIDYKVNGHIVMPPSVIDAGQYTPVAGRYFGEVKLLPYKALLSGTILRERKGALEKLGVGPVDDRNDSLYRFARNVKWEYKRRTHSDSKGDRLEKRVRGAAIWRFQARDFANLKPDDPFTLAEVEKIVRNVLDTPDREQRQEEASADFSKFGRLIKHLTEPPRFEIFYDGVSIKVDIKTLFTWNLLRLRVGEELLVVLPEMKNSYWTPYLSTLMESCEVVEAPDDAGEAGVLREHLLVFLGKVDLKAPEDRAALKRGAPIVHTRPDSGVKGLVFRGSSFDQFLRMNHFKGMASADVWMAVRRFGAEKISLRVPRSHDSTETVAAQVWFLPLDQLPEGLFDEIPAPEFKSEI